MITRFTDSDLLELATFGYDAFVKPLIICGIALLLVATNISQMVFGQAQTNKADWELVRSVPDEYGGTVDFVLIPEAKQRDRAYYEQVGNAVCQQRTSCMVNFWADRKHIPQTQTAWLPAADLAVMTASYERSPKYTRPALHLACWLYLNKSAGEADKCDYEPGAKRPPDK